MSMQNITCRCRKIIFPRKKQNACYKQLAFSILQNLSEEQKCIRGTGRGLHFCKETHKICKNAFILEFLAYLHFVAW